MPLGPEAGDSRERLVCDMDMNEATGVRVEVKVVDPTVCDCDCHSEEDPRAISTCPHCCDICPKCDRRVKTGLMKRHLRRHLGRAARIPT